MMRTECARQLRLLRLNINATSLNYAPGPRIKSHPRKARWQARSQGRPQRQRRPQARGPRAPPRPRRQQSR
eukprot:10656396-Alexandrium_andersonii.AAC.1